MIAPTKNATFHDARPSVRSAHDWPLRLPAVTVVAAPPREHRVAARRGHRPGAEERDHARDDRRRWMRSRRRIPSTASPLVNNASTAIPVLTLVTRPPA